MEETEVLAYVKAAAVALALPLDEARAQRVATHLARTAALARQLEAFELGVEHEPADIYRIGGEIGLQPASSKREQL